MLTHISVASLGHLRLDLLQQAAHQGLGGWAWALMSVIQVHLDGHGHHSQSCGRHVEEVLGVRAPVSVLSAPVTVNLFLHRSTKGWDDVLDSPLAKDLLLHSLCNGFGLDSCMRKDVRPFGSVLPCVLFLHMYG